MPRTDPGSAGRVLRPHPVVQVVEPQPGVDRHPPDGPRVLRVQAEIGNQPLVRGVRCGSNRHLERLPDADGQVRILVGPHVGIGRPFLQRHARLERVRAGHVVDRAAIGAHRGVIARERSGVGAEVDAGRQLGDRIAGRRGRVLHRLARPGLVHHPCGGLEQQLRRHRRREPQRLEVVLRKMLQVRRVRLFGAHQRPVVGVAWRDVPIPGQFVLGADLPGEAEVIADASLRFGARTREIGRVDERGLIPFVERVRPDLLVAPEAVRRPEPQPVLLQRTADRDARVVNPVDAVCGRDALAAQRVVDVVALQAVVREIEER